MILLLMVWLFTAQFLNSPLFPDTCVQDLRGDFHSMFFGDLMERADIQIPDLTTRGFTGHAEVSLYYTITFFR